jgi:alkylation response protein AidB-like acyl-CoA dehydrogenase
MHGELPDTTLLREAVRRVVAPYGFEYFASVSEAKGNPTELWKELGRNGYLGVNIPEEYGGGGSGISELAAITEEVAANGCPLMLFALSPAVCATIITQFGTEEQKRKWLPLMATGDAVVAFAITEPDAGLNTRRIQTRARRDGDGWVLTGSKYYVSHVDNSQAILVVARTGTDEATGKALLSLFLVDTDAPGLERSLIEVDMLSPERQFTLHFDSVRLGPDALIGEEHKAFGPLFAGLNPERIGSAALLNGLSRYVLDKASAYARERVVWDAPIGTHQAIAHPLARAHIQLRLAQLATAHAAALYDRGEDEKGEMANVAKHAASEAAHLALDAAIQTHGGNGMSREYGIAAFLGLVRLFRIAPVSNEMILNHIAQHSLGLPRSY